MNGKSGNLTTVVRPPPLDADIEFVAGRGVGRKRHALVVDILFISDPDVTERARWDLETEKAPNKDHRILLLPPHLLFNTILTTFRVLMEFLLGMASV